MGGAERVLVDIVNKLQEKFDITIFCIYGNGGFEKELNPNVNLIKLYNNSYEEQTSFKKKIIPIKVLICGKLIYKKYISNNYDYQIAFLEGPITRIFKYGNKNKIAWIHNDISQVFGKSFKAKIKLCIDKRNYKKYDKLVFVSNDNKNAFNELYKLNGFEKKEEVIYNYIEKERILKKSCMQVGQEYIENTVPSILTVTRLTEQKAIDRLINVHKKLIDEKIYHNIYVIGDGPEREKLLKQIKNLGVQGTFKLMGKRENPYPYMKRAEYFVLLSKFEGYGMVVDEAKILNKKIIITNTAAVEAVKGYTKKIIVENNENAIYEGLKQVLQKNVIFEEDDSTFENNNLILRLESLFQ